ncbi:hypothetical protein ACFL2O_03640 [Thermodesulfobacteriota bacterium]
MKYKMLKRSAIIFIVLGFYLSNGTVSRGETKSKVKVSYFRPERSESHRRGHCKGTKVKRGDIKLIPLTIGEGMGLPVPNSSVQYKKDLTSYFDKIVEYADRAGVSVYKNAEDFYSVGTKNNWFFLLYFNLASAKKCKREYLIQRVKVTTGSYGKGGRNSYRGKTLYLVEVMKLRGDKKTGRGDQHLRVYSLGRAFKRKIEVECEIGWGCIRGDLEGDEWPYGESVLYKELQGYSERPGLYDKIRFEVSRKYVTKMEFDKDGKGSVQLPAFLRGGR